MSLLDWFRSDPTQDWQQPVARTVVLDLVNFSIDGVHLGDPGSALSAIGRPSNKRPFRDLRFLYEVPGVVIELHSEVVSYFGLPVQRVSTDLVGPCTVSVIFPDGTQMPVTKQTNVETILSYLPEPSSMDRDEMEVVFNFMLRGNVLEIECCPRGTVRRLNLFPEEDPA